MVTLNKIGNNPNTNYMTIYGLSTDIKPVDVFEDIRIANGSVFIEMDTDKKFYYDAENSAWN